MFMVSTSGQIVIEKIAFVTSREVSLTLKGERTGLPDDSLVCYVELQGAFTFPAPPGRAPGVVHKVYEVFDAHTGNLLMLGGLA